MKKVIFHLLILCTLNSCEKAIDVELASTKPILVIDAVIAVDSSIERETFKQVKLTQTANFFENQVQPARRAEVRIIDNNTNITYSLIEDEENPGIFKDGFPNFEFAKTYTLEVLYKNETYQATTQLVPTGKITAIEQGAGFLFDEENETEIIISFADIPNERNYYLLAFGFNNYLVTNDEFYQDKQLTFSYFYENLNPGNVVTISLLGINRDFASYMDKILTQATGDSGAFSIPPANVRGNFQNINAPQNYAFGYFSLSEINSATYTVK